MHIFCKKVNAYYYTGNNKHIFFNENLYITRLECAAITHVSRINVSSEMQVLVVL